MKYLVSFWDLAAINVGEVVLDAESETELLEMADEYAEENFPGFGITEYKFRALSEEDACGS